MLLLLILPVWQWLLLLLGRQLLMLLLLLLLLELTTRLGRSLWERAESVLAHRCRISHEGIANGLALGWHSTALHHRGERIVPLHLLHHGRLILLLLLLHHCSHHNLLLVTHWVRNEGWLLRLLLLLLLLGDGWCLTAERVKLWHGLLCLHGLSLLLLQRLL